MDGAKSKYIAASEVYAAIDSGNTSLCVAPDFDAVARSTTSPRGTRRAGVAQRSGIAVSHQYFGRCEIAHLRACSMGPRGG
jgi:hypothetical protein